MIYFVSKQVDKSVISYNDVVLTGINKVKEDLLNVKEIVLDCETNGLNPLINQILVLQFGTQENQYVVDMRDYSLQEFKSILEDPTKVFIGHNIKFDYNMLKQYGIILRNVYDTMLADMVIYNDAYSKSFIKKEHRFSLSGVHKHYFGNWVKKSMQSKMQYISNRPLNYDMVKYAALDVYYPQIIKEKQIELITKYNLTNCVNLENKTALVLGDIEYNGFQLHTQKWLIIVDKYKERLLKTERALDLLLLKQDNGERFRIQARQLNLFEDIHDHRETVINWRSDQQVLHILQNIFHLYPKDKNGKPSSGADAIEFLPNPTEFTDLLLKYREETKVVDSFGDEYIKKNVDIDGRVHTSFMQIVSTGRVSSREPNLQQIKGFNAKDEDSKLFREAFCVPEGYKLSTADYSQQEARIMADLAQDETYINFFNTGDGDIHSFVASKMFSAKFKTDFKVSTTENTEYRQKGKTLNFAISFGAGAFTLAKRLKIDESEAQELINSFYEGFPTLKQFFDTSKEFGLKYGYVKTNNYTNRIRWFTTWKEYIQLKDSRFLSSDSRKRLMQLKGYIERRAINTIIQGTAGDITKLALVLIREELLKNNIQPFTNAPIKLVNVIHDEIVLEGTSDLIEFWAEKQKECMERAGSFICKRVSLPAGNKIKSYWTH